VELGIKYEVERQAEQLTIRNLTLEKSSKLQVCQLEIAVRSAGGATASVTLPEGFVVVSNEKQWQQAQGSILSARLFPGEEPGCVSAYEVCNVLQDAYLHGIREKNLADPKRPLSPQDFLYIFNTTLSCGLEGQVSKEQFGVLWKWFGSALTSVRHDKVVLEMWCQGYVMGFVGKGAAEALLRLEPPGSFLLRFSSQAPGVFAIAFTAPEGQAVNHYLMKKTDLNASNSLAKFLLTKPYFHVLLQTVPSFQTPSWQRVPKAKALRKWESKIKTEEDAVQGYDDQLNIPLHNLSISK
jgi:hypothetical protein